MVPSHANAFLDVARRRNEVIMVRPVNRLCTSLIEEGYATKGLHVKGKSSDWGPQAGMICVNQAFSKLKSDRWEAFNGKVKDSLEAGDAVAVELRISGNRIAELESLGVVKRLQSLGPGIDLEAQSPAGNMVRFTAVPAAVSGEKAMFKIQYSGQAGGMGQPGTVLTVLADPSSRLPLTADYDLFALCPRWESVDLSTSDRFQLKNAEYSHQMQPMTVEHSAGGEGIKQKIAALEASANRMAVSLNRMHVDMGNVSERQKSAVADLNRAAQGAGYKGGNVVHHGAETGNPFTEVDFPIISFDPTNGGREVVGIQNEGELKSYFLDLRERGFYASPNPRWRKKDWTKKDEQGSVEQLRWGAYRPGVGWVG